MDKLLQRYLSPFPALAPGAVRMAGTLLLAWNPGAAAPSPFAVGYVCALGPGESLYAALGGFVGYLLTGSRLGAAFACALACCMALQLLFDLDRQLPAAGAALCLCLGLAAGEGALWRLVLTCALSGLISQFLRLSETGAHGLSRYSLSGKLALLCLVLVVLRPLSVVGGLLTLAAALWLLAERRGTVPAPKPRLAPAAVQKPPPYGKLGEALSALRRAAAPEPELPDPPEARALARAAETVCRGCPRRGDCWKPGGLGARTALDHAAPALRSSHRLSSADLPAGFTNLCARSEALCAAAEAAYTAALRRQARQARDRRQQRRMEQQLAGMQALLAKCAAGEARSPGLERKARAVAAAYCPEAACGVYRTGGRLTVRLTLPENAPEPDLSALHKSMALALNCRLSAPEKQGRAVTMTRRETLALQTALHQRPRQGEQVCGDWACAFRLEGRGLVLLSDGMGSGEPARTLSRTALELIAAFLKAGCGLEDSTAAVLPVLEGRAEQAGFATLDLLEADLYTGEATLLKYGAARSFFLREGRVTPLAGSALPPGLEEGGPDRCRLQLRPGDRLLLVSDGVEDPAPLLEARPGLAPEALCRALLDRSDGRDDRTALLVSVSAK